MLGLSPVFLLLLLRGQTSYSISIEDIDDWAAVKTTTPSEQCGSKPAEMVFMLDSSGSVMRTNWQKELDFVRRFVNDSTIGPNNTQVGLVTFSTTVSTYFQLNKYHNKTSMMHAIKMAPYLSGQTFTGKALAHVRQSAFSVANGARPGVKRILIVVTDGASTNHQNMILEAKKLHQTNIEVYAIGVGKANEQELKTIATSDKHVFLVPDFSALKAVESVIEQKICATKEPVCGVSPVDILFLVDTSGSVGLTHYREELAFLSKFVNDSLIGPKSLQVGVVTFSTNTIRRIALSAYSNKSDLLAAIKRIPYSSGLTYTDKAIHFVRTQGFSASNGGRPTARRVLIVITDGKSSNHRATLVEASNLHMMAIDVYAIGVGLADRKELETIASNKKYVYMVKDFEALQKIERNVRHTVCSTRPPPVCGVSPGDIVFLLDTSGSISNVDFQKQLNFVATFVNDSEIGHSGAQIGLVTFTTDVINEFWLNTHLDKASLVKAVLAIKRRTGVTNTDLGLRFVREKSFLPEHGHRSGVPTTVILITDGHSSHPTNTDREANLIHATNITVVAIGVGSNVNLAELQKIATGSHVFQVPSYQTLTEIKKKLFSAVCGGHF